MLTSLWLKNFTLFAETSLEFSSHLNVIIGENGLGKTHIWDEPEANLNPKLIKLIARTIITLCQNNIQVFIATHSLFLLRELYIVHRQEFPKTDTRYIGVHPGQEGGVDVFQGITMDEIGDITSLDEELEQSERYLDVEH